MSPFPLFKSCPQQLQCELWEKIPFPHPVLPRLHGNALLWAVTRSEDFCLGVEEGCSALPRPPTPQRSRSAWVTKHQCGGLAGVKTLAMTKNEALRWQHTRYRKWQSYAEVQVQVGESPYTQYFLSGRCLWWAQPEYRETESKVSGAVEAIWIQPPRAFPTPQPSPSCCRNSGQAQPCYLDP